MKTAYYLVALGVVLLMAALACGALSSTTALPATTPVVTRPADTEKISWQSRWDSAVAKAKAEGTVVVYSTANPATTQALKKGLQERYGIDIEFVMGKGEEFMPRIQSERRAGLYLGDVIIPGATPLFLIMKPQGVLQALEPALILPEVAEPAMWYGQKVPFLDRDKLTFGFASRVNSFITVNTEAVKKGEIKSFRNLLDPKWKGKITMMDPTVSGGGILWAQTMLAAYGQKEGRDYLEEIVKQEPVLLRDKRLQVEWLARNKYPLTIAPDVQTFDELKRAGAPIYWERASEGVSSTNSGAVLGLLTQPAHPNAAIVFINWLLSKEGQTIFQANYAVPTIRADVDKSGIDPAYLPREGERIILTETEEVLMERPKVMEAAKQIFAPVIR